MSTFLPTGNYQTVPGRQLPASEQFLLIRVQTNLFHEIQVSRIFNFFTIMFLKYFFGSFLNTYTGKAPSGKMEIIYIDPYLLKLLLPGLIARQQKPDRMQKYQK
jgi:hypothetical protein